MKLWGNQIFVKQIKSVFHSFLLKINLLHFRIFQLSNKKSKIIFIDIDNTIANTAGFIKKNNIFDSKNAMSISPLNGTIDFINQNFSDYKFIFLSHRSVLIYQTTKKWLVHNDIWKTGSHLYLVSNAVDKIKFFKLCLKIIPNPVIIDDISYGHENGEVKTYSKIDQFIKKNNIDHYGKDFINDLNKDVLH